MKNSKRLLAGLAVLSVLVVAGCGGSSSKTTTTTGKLTAGLPVAVSQTQLLNYQNSVTIRCTRIARSPVSPTS